MTIYNFKFKLFIFILNFITIQRANESLILKYQIPKTTPSGGPLNKEFFKILVRAYGLDTFIETGTFAGETTNNALNYFKEIHSIELDPNIYKKTKEFFKNENHVSLYLGQSEIILEQILGKIKGNVLIWLDAHYSGPGTAKGTKLTPVIDELNAIKNSKIKNAIILVDDIMWHNYNHGKEVDYPNFEILYKEFKKINNQYEVILIGDVICAFPPNSSVKFSPVLKACAKSILCSMTEIDNLLEQENIISKATDSEKDAIISYWKVYKNHSFCDIPIFNFWYGLICLEDKNLKTAIELFQKAETLGLSLNRIKPHLKKFLG